MSGHFGRKIYDNCYTLEFIDMLIQYKGSDNPFCGTTDGSWTRRGGVFFDGNNDVVVMSQQESLNVSNSMALVTWFSVANTLEESVKTLAYKMNPTDTAGYHLYVTGNTLFADINPTSVNNSIVLSSNISSNTWTMAAFTYDGTKIRGYINGQLTNTSIGNATATTDSNSSLYIGSANSSNIMYGKVGVVQVYNRSLSNTEITNSFNRYRGRFGI